MSEVALEVEFTEASDQEKSSSVTDRTQHDHHVVRTVKAL